MLIELTIFRRASLSFNNRQTITESERSSYTGADDLRSPDGIQFESNLIWTSNEVYTNMKWIN